MDILTNDCQNGPHEDFKSKAHMNHESNMNSDSTNDISEHRAFLLSALERVEQGELATIVLNDAPLNAYSLCQEILLGCQRWNGSLEHIIRLNTRKNPKKGVRRILKLALYELYFLKKPPHAVIDQAVRLCKQGKFKAQQKFVNAFLRQVEYPEGVYANQNFPDWLMDLWRQNGRWLKSLQEHPKSGMVFVNPSSQEAYVDKYVDKIETQCTVDAEIVKGCFYSTQSGPISQWKGYDDGEWWIMNPAAAYVVDRMFSHIEKSQPRVLDVCSAPGGKAFRMASLGATVTATDISPSRIRRLLENRDRLKMSSDRIDIIEQDCLISNPALGEYDGVFLDAPCSGLGVIRKHPEIRWNRSLEDVQTNAVLQKKLLQSASVYVSKAGVLAYCVCSLHPMEGQDVVDAFIEQNKEWKIIDIWKTPIDSKHIQVEKLDGFQLFVLKRSGGLNDK